MFGKLMKYELRSLIRLFAPMWLGLLVLAALNRITLHTNIAKTALNGIPATLLMILFVVGIIAIAVCALVMLVRRFYVGLLKDEGYLMFTLPTRPSALIWSKCLTSTILLLVTALVCVGSIMLLVATEGFVETVRDILGALLDPITDERTGAVLVHGAAAGFLALLATTVAAILQAYVSMAIGQLFNRHKLAWSVGVYLLLNILLSSLLTTGLNLLSNVNFHSPVLNRIFYGSIFFATAPTQTQVIQMIWIIFGLFILIGTVQSVVFYFVTNYLLKNRLNLE